MELLQINIKDFLGIKKACIDFKGKGLFSIQGVNGAGKTSILEAVYYSLFEKSLRFSGNSKAELVNVYSQDGIATIETLFLKGDGTKITIKRFIGKNSRYMRYDYTDGKSVEFTKNEEIRKEIEQLGFFPQNFKYSVILPQGGANAFIEAKKEDKKKVLEVFLDLQKLEITREKIGNEAAFIYGKIKSIKDEIENVEKEKPEEVLENLVNELDIIENDIKKYNIIKENLGVDFEKNRIILGKFSEKRKYQEKKDILKKETEVLRKEAEEDVMIMRAKEILPDYIEYKNIEEKFITIIRENEKKQKEISGIQKETEEKKMRKQNIAITLNNNIEKFDKINSEFEERKSKFEKINEIPAKIETMAENKEKTEKEIIKINLNIDKYLKELEEKKANLLNYEKKINENNEIMKRLEEESENIEKIKIVSQIAEIIKHDKLDKCPVCANAIDYREIEIPHFKSDMRDEIRKTEKIIREYSVLKAEAASEINSINKNIENEKLKIEEKEIELDSIKRSGKLLVEILRENGFKNIEEAKQFSDYAKEQEKIIKKETIEIQKFEKEISVLENTLEISEKNINSLREKFGENIILAEKYQNEMDVKEKTYRKHIADIKITEEEFLRLSKKKITGAFEKISEKENQIKSIMESETELETKLKGYIEEEVFAENKKMEEETTATANKLNELHQEKGRKEREAEEIKKRLINYKKLKDETVLQEQEYIKLSMLKDYLAPSKFPRYIMSKFLSRIIEETNKNLELLTKGKYRIKSDEEMDLTVVDTEKGGIERSVESLSGGEKTIISLGLSFAISDNVSRGIKFFFIDEGFSPLDKDNLRYVYENLNQFVKTGKTVGVITHDRDFAECFDERLNVKKGGVIEWQ